MQRFISAADEVAEYEQIWGRAPTAGQLRRQSAIMENAASRGLNPIAATPTTTAAKEFLSLYNSSAADVVTLIGHNEGGAFRFPDGSVVDLGSLGSSGGPVLALISCDSAFYASGQAVGLPTPVTFEVALDVERRFASGVASLATPPTPGQAQEILAAALTEAANARTEQFKIYALSGAGVTVAGVGIYQVVEN